MEIFAVNTPKRGRQPDSLPLKNIAPSGEDIAGEAKADRPTKPWLRRATASAVSQMVRERCLSSSQASFVVNMIIKPDQNLLGEFLAGLRPLTASLGKSELAFQQFVLLICTNRLINTPHTLAVALNMDDRSQLSANLHRTIVPSVIEDIGISPMERPRRHRDALPESASDSIWELGLRSIAVCDILVRLPQDRKSELLPALWQATVLPVESTNYRKAAELHLLNLLKEISAQNIEFAADRDSSRFYFIDDEEYVSKIKRRITSFYSSRKSDVAAHRLLQNIIRHRIIITINELLLDGLILHYNETDEKAEFIEEILKNSLHPLFDAAQFPEERRAEFVAQIMFELFEYEDRAQGSWSAGIRAERAALSGEMQLTLPERAPAIWKDDKLDGDSPPDFIKRHYGPWLRDDGTGLTRPDIKRLDRTLYVAIANWLQKDGNAFPSDCPVPTKSEAIDLELARHSDGQGSLSARTWWAKRSRDRAAKQREDQSP